MKNNDTFRHLKGSNVNVKDYMFKGKIVLIKY